MFVQGVCRHSGGAGWYGDVAARPGEAATRRSAPRGRRERMNCEEILTLLDAYFDNELDLAKTVAIEEQLRTCASCRSQYELRVALRRRLDDPGFALRSPQ